MNSVCKMCGGKMKDQGTVYECQHCGYSEFKEQSWSPFDQRGQVVGRQINCVTGDGNVVGSGNVVTTGVNWFHKLKGALTLLTDEEFSVFCAGNGFHPCAGSRKMQIMNLMMGMEMSTAQRLYQQLED